MQNLARDEAGNIWELDAQGEPVRLAEPAAQGRVFSLPQNPREARQDARQDRAELRSEAAAARSAANEERRIRFAEEAAARDAEKAAAPSEARQKAKDNADAKLRAARALQRQLGEMREIYERSFKGVGPIQSIREMLPTADAERFKAIARSMRADLKPLVRGPGEGTFTEGDQALIDELIPDPRSFDSSNEQTFSELESRIGDVLRQFGEDSEAAKPEQRADNEVPDPTTGAELKPPAPGEMLDRTTPTDLSGERGPNQAVASGPDRQVYDARLSAQVDAMINAGASKAMIDAVVTRQGFPTINAGDLARAKTWMKANPGKRYFGAQISRTEDMNPLQQIAGSDTGAFLAHMANNATAGIPAALAGPEGQGALDAMAASSPGAAGFGGLTGGVTGMLGAEAAVAARAPAALARFAPRVADTLYGGVLGFNQAREGEGGLGALLGGASGLAGGVIGRQIGKRVGRLGGSRMSGADRSVLGSVSGDFDAIRPQLGEAQRLGVPLSLADTDPRLRTLAGAVSRKSVNARDQAERIFDPRNLGQADRAIDAIDTHLAPITDIAARGRQHIDNARLNSNPLYEAAKARAAPVDEEVAALLRSPAGQDALQRAQGIAGNEGRNPLAMGFDLDDQGEIVLREMPSFETLDLVKRGFDARLSEARNPITGQLDLTGNPELAAIEGLRKRFVGRLDELNSAYPEARAAYAAEAAKKDALDRGYKAPTSALPPRDLNRVVNGLKPDQLPEYQRGYATSLADATERTRLSSNPYSAIYGSPAQMEKIGTVFPQGAPAFGRVADFEREMAKTRYEVLGGSPTAARLQADEQIGGGMGTAALDFGSQLMTGGGLNLGSILTAGRRMVGDSMKLGVGRQAVKRAEEIAPTLFDTNPQAGVGYLDDLLARAARTAARSQAAGQVGGSLGAGVLTQLLVGP